MAKTYQLSLLQTGQGKGYLFGKDALESYLDQHKSTPIKRKDDAAREVYEWVQSVAATSATEQSLEHTFLSRIVCGILGYTAYPAPGGETATLYAKPTSRVTNISTPPDAVLGMFGEADQRILAVLELKSPGTDLDLPQSGYEYKSPVAQGFHYGTSILGVRWVLVTDMRIVRLYSVDSQDAYEEIDFADCVTADGRATAEFRRLQFLLHHDYLISAGDTSQVSLLYSKSADRQIAIRDGFYNAYYRIRLDLHDAIKEASAALVPQPSAHELLEAAQRLLDRILFIYYCEDHPQQLIKKNTVSEVTQAARRLPGTDNCRVYEALKALFRKIDEGSPLSSGVQVQGYNGELFKTHRIVDGVRLPDALHDRRYDTEIVNGKSRQIHGAWGLHVFDFWSELNGHLLGHIFEESLSDFGNLAQTTEVSDAEQLQQKRNERKRFGIFYTTRVLSDFLCNSALKAILEEEHPIRASGRGGVSRSVKARLKALLNLRVADFACGSGAFLVSAFREILQEFWRLRTSLAAIESDDREVDIFSAAEPVAEARLLPRCVFGVDKLPQAAEIAKLAIWLRSARKDEKVLDLSDNIIAADSLDVPAVFERLGASVGAFDIVVGNPPWGGEVDADAERRVIEFIGGASGSHFDSWELFLLLGLNALREGGRLALVLPDSFFYPQKAPIRRLLFERATIEKVYNLGPDWFGKNVRMGTVLIQARRGPLRSGATASSLVLSGALRQSAIAGSVPIAQIEAQRSRLIPLDRTPATSAYEIEVFRSVDDDRIIADIEARSVPLSELCERGRGEEMNKSGLLWICPGCLSPTTPGEKQKGGGYRHKACPTCGFVLNEQNVERKNLVFSAESLLFDESAPPPAEVVAFIDGDDINRRFRRVTPKKKLWLGMSGWKHKDAETYNMPKILVRQAGIGLVATLDETGAWCPQSVYIYRLLPAQLQAGLRHEFLLAALLSRTMAYVIFKRFAEFDSAKAHAKLTHARLAALPVPRVDLQKANEKKLHQTIVDGARALLDGRAELGGAEDRRIESALRELWGVSAADGAYINGEFHDLPESQVMTDLFPDGRPKPIRKEIVV